MDRDPRRTISALAVVATSVIAIAVVGLVYLRTSTPLFSQSGYHTASPSPTALTAAWNGTCPSTEMKFTGVFNECATVDKGMSCPSGSLTQIRIFRMHGTKDDFIVYVEVDGNYHGPGTYALAPWPHDSFGVSDGVAKLAVRDYSTGRLWESSAGSLTIDSLENGGYVYAGLGPSTNSPVVVELNVAGWWSCSQ